VGLTVIVNMLTVAHKGSSGMSISFPDVCKTPTPAGPIPIPYPNIAQSSDVTSGSSTVKMDGGMIMNKSSNMMMSTGDEAGAAMGVVSSKIKGKAEFVNYSFDVKVDGKNVCRLTDPAQTNMGSANSIAPACVQMPLVAMAPQIEACKKTKEAEKAQEDPKKEGKTTNWSDSGVADSHKKAFEDAATDRNVVIFLRRGSKYCIPWIEKKFQPKPHSIINGNSLKEKPKLENSFIEWLDKYWAIEKPNWFHLKSAWFKLCKPPIPKPENYKEFYGIVIDNQTGEPCRGKGCYIGKWVTGDYDLMDVVDHNNPDCRRLTGKDYRILQHMLNKKMQWDGIQHGPQAYWCSKPEDWKKGAEKFNLAYEICQYLKKTSDERKPYDVRRQKLHDVPEKIVAKGPPPRKMPVLDGDCTVIAPGGHVVKTDGDDTIDALVCCGCHKLEAWGDHDSKSGFRSEN
jgi:hypothetical protein